MRCSRVSVWLFMVCVILFSCRLLDVMYIAYLVMWCLCVRVVFGVLLCCWVWLIALYMRVVCCNRQNVMGDVVLVCGCGDWRLGLLCVIAFSYWLLVVMDRTWLLMWCLCVGVVIVVCFSWVCA